MADEYQFSLLSEFTAYALVRYEASYCHPSYKLQSASYFLELKSRDQILS